MISIKEKNVVIRSSNWGD